jgi:hypothetical protein
VFYLGPLPDRATLRGVIEQACRHACVGYRTDLPPGVEAVKRLDLLMSAIVGPAVVLEPRGVMVLNARYLQKLKVCGSARVIPP